MKYINNKKAFILVLALFLFGPIAYSEASTYYISPNGNDSNNGSTSSPWKTLSKACQTATNSGDLIHVNSGTYIETGQCSLSIGVSIEGDGESSIIKSTSTSDWTPIIILSSPEGTNGNQHISNIKLDGQNLSTFWAIWVSGRSNVSVYNTTIVDFKDRGIIFSGRTDGEEGAPSIYATGNKYYNNICSNSAAYNTSTGIYGRGCLNIGGQKDMEIYGNTITQNQRPEGYNGWPIKGYNDGYLKGVRIYNNTLIKKPYGGTYPGETGWDFAIELFNVSGVEIANNTIQGSIDSNTQTKDSYAYSMWIHDNTISQPTLNSRYESGIILEFSTDTAIIENNKFNNVSMGVQFNTRDRSIVSNINIRNNLMTNLGRAVGDGNNGGAIAFITETTHNATLSNINIYNNTMIAAPNNAPWEGIEFGDAVSGSGGSASNFNVKNNIIIGFKNAWLRANTPTHASNINVTNNDAYNNANNNEPLWPGGNPQNYVYSNNLNLDPVFTNTTDYKLSSSSPLVNAGVNVGLPFVGSAPDIGYSESSSTSGGPSGGGGNNNNSSGGNGAGSGSGSGGTQSNTCPSGTKGIYPDCVSDTTVNPPPLPVVANNPIYFIKVVKINIRASKNITSKLIATLKERDLVEVLEGNTKTEWIKVKTLGEKIGYVRSKYTSILPIVGSQVSIVGKQLNLRKFDSATGSVLKVLKPNDIFEVISISSNGNWVKVKTKDNFTGFVNRFYLKVLN